MKIRLDYVSNSSSSSYTMPSNSDDGSQNRYFPGVMDLSEFEQFKYRDLRVLSKEEIASALRWYNGQVSDLRIRAETIICDTEGKPIKVKNGYFAIPTDIDSFISWLMGISFSHNIVNLVNVSHEFSISVAPSKDGDTNIDDHIIEEFLVRLGRTKDGGELKESDQ